MTPVTFVVLWLASVGLWQLAGNVPGVGAAESLHDSTNGLDYWRRPENDGYCCLFVLLRQLGYDKAFREYLRGIDASRAGPTCQDLVRIARSQGYTIATVRSSIVELRKVRSPVIVHLERVGKDTSYFAVPLHFGDTEVTLFHGPTATLTHMDVNDFRRQWTGIALAPSVRSGRAGQSQRMGALVGGGVLVLVCIVLVCRGCVIA